MSSVELDAEVARATELFKDSLKSLAIGIKNSPSWKTFARYSGVSAAECGKYMFNYGLALIGEGPLPQLERTHEHVAKVLREVVYENARSHGVDICAAPKL